ncbi:MAG: Ca2+-binding RTX toxin-like protein [Yoonia sp.]|jgi:Ca2+-binding RTX toxin-like protein
MNFITKVGTSVTRVLDYNLDAPDIEFGADNFYIAHNATSSSTSNDNFVDLLEYSSAGVLGSEVSITPNGTTEVLQGMEVLTEGEVVNVFIKDGAVDVNITNPNGTTSTVELLSSIVNADHVSVTSLVNGNFALIYEDNSDSNNNLTRVHVFDREGGPVGSGPHTITTTPDNDEEGVAGALVNEGNATFSLEDGGFGVTFNNNDKLQLLTFKDNGEQEFTEELPYVGDDIDAENVTATQLENGSILVVYAAVSTSNNSNIPTTLQGYILPPVYSTVGGEKVLTGVGSVTAADRMQLSDRPTGDNEFPDAAATDDGGFILVWQNYTSSTDISGYMRRFEADMTPFGASERITTGTTVEEEFKVAVMSSDEMMVTWVENGGSTGNSYLASQSYRLDDEDTGTGTGTGPTEFDDDLRGDAANNTIDLLEGKDRYSGAAGDDTVYGNDGVDIIFGGNGNDKLYGGDGDDRLKGKAGDDILYGDANKDILKGGFGNDTIYGGDDDDQVLGKGDDDTLYGGAGKDTLKGGKGNDLLYGGDDDDQVLGKGGNDTLYGDAGNDTLKGGGGKDVLHGDAGNDVLLGRSGDDTMYGGGGDDLLKGGNGDDILYGGEGDNTLDGGAGKDTFVFSRASGDSTIADFDLFSDVLAFARGSEFSSDDYDVSFSDNDDGVLELSYIITGADNEEISGSVTFEGIQESDIEPGNLADLEALLIG